MVGKHRKARRRAVARSIESELKGFELGLSLEDVMADLNFGVGTLADAVVPARKRRHEVGRPA